jgi:hypothetical protein
MYNVKETKIDGMTRLSTVRVVMCKMSTHLSVVSTAALFFLVTKGEPSVELTSDTTSENAPTSLCSDVRSDTDDESGNGCDDVKVKALFMVMALSNACYNIDTQH